MKDTIIFDLDGTLLNTLDDILDGVNHALYKFNLPSITDNECKSFIGNGPKMLIKRSVKDRIDLLEDVYNEYLIYYDTHNDIKTSPYPGVMDMLECLHKKGYKLAIVSNKQDSAVKLMADRYFKSMFDFVIGSKESLGKKPQPDMVFEAIKQLNTNLERSYYIGDSDVDIKTASNSNIDSIMVSWGFRDKKTLLDNGATLIVDTTNELMDIIMKRD